MNSVNIIGNIGNDIDVKYTGNGNAVTNINVAVNEYSNGEQVTQWFKVTVWGEKAENLAKYCGKGSKVGVSGRLRNNTFTDKNGNERRDTEITAISIDFLDSRQDSNQQGYGNGQWSPTQGVNQKPQQSNQGQQVNTFTAQDVKQNNTDPFAGDKVEIQDSDLPF